MENNRHFIFDIDGILVSSDILTVCFACDYQKCKGACCIEGDSGAPLLEEEETFLEDNFEQYEEFLTPEGKAVLNNQGFATVDFEGDFVTPLVHNRECAYACFDENDNCLCAVEKGICKYKGMNDNSMQPTFSKISATPYSGSKPDSGSAATSANGFIKPISCRLYPIRVTTLKNGSTALNLHRWKICEDAFERGSRLGIPAYKFLKEPIIARFGEEFYHALEAAAKSMDSQ